MSHLRAALILTMFVLVTLPCMAVQLVLLLVAPHAARRFARGYWAFLAWLTDTRVRVRGEAISGGHLLVVNHASWLDIVVLGSMKPMSFVAKREVASWPLIGIIARLGRTVFIDRDSRQAVRWSHEEMRSRLAGGETLVLFPEGTSSDGNRVLPFRSALLGAAEVEVDGRPVPVQPVTIAYRALWGLPLDRRRRPFFAWYGDMPLLSHLWQALAMGPVDVDVIFHPPRTLAEAGGRKALADYCEKAIRHGLAEALAGDRRTGPVSLWRQAA